MTRAASFGVSLAFLAAFAASFAHLPAVVSAQAGAQIGLGGFGADITLSISPLYPSPNTNVHMEARSTSVDLDALDILWYKNGEKIGDGAGVKEIDIVAGALGSEMTIEAVASEDGFEVASAQARIVPTEIDLLFESDSYVPPFYEGRAVPSAGTLLRLEAIPRFKRPNGSFVATNDIIFTWKRGGSVISSASGRGRATVSLESPGLFGSDLISVEARTPDGKFSGSASARVTPTEPRLLLYKDHPLFGVMYHQALAPQFTGLVAQNFIPETEMSFAAVPYFAGAVDANDGRLIYAWRINGNDIANDPSRPSQITINAERSSGNALIELALSHATNFFMSSFGRWGVTLAGGNGGGTSGGSGAKDPFGGPAQ
ncbi:MAG: hypothetical protein AAB665_03945 [Patescibacteria group bacterium]